MSDNEIIMTYVDLEKNVSFRYKRKMKGTYYINEKIHFVLEMK